MSDFNQRSAQRAVRELEDQRRKNAQFMDMLDEVHGAAAVVACDDFSHGAWVLLYAGRRQLRQRRRCHCAALKADQRTRWGWARPGWARIRRWRGGRGKAARARAPTTPVAELRGRIPRHRCPSGCTRPIRRGETRRRDESAQVRGHGAMSRGNRPLTFLFHTCRRAFRASNAGAAMAPAPAGGKEPETPDGKSFVNTAALRPMLHRPLRRGDPVRQVVDVVSALRAAVVSPPARACWPVLCDS